MAEFSCPFCGVTNAIIPLTYSESYFPRDKIRTSNLGNVEPHEEAVLVKCYTCAHCGKVSFTASRTWGEHQFFTNVFPSSTHIRFPDYIPAAIRADYEEAHAIMHISPRAAATLCRRCLQGMIRDFWGISKRTLNDEISALQPLIPALQWQVLDSMRKLGNIGAHMVNLIIDIDRDTAGKLVKLIEHLLKEWYVNRHDTQALYKSIINADSDAQEKRRS